MADLAAWYFINKLSKQIENLLQSLEEYGGGAVKFTNMGTTNFIVPMFVNTIYVSGIGAGGGGGGGSCGSYRGSSYAGAGGGSGGHGEELFDQEIQVTPGEILTIKIEDGGSGGSGGFTYSDDNRSFDGSDGNTGGATTLSRGNTVLFSVNPGTGGKCGKCNGNIATRTPGEGGTIGGNTGLSHNGEVGGDGGAEAHSSNFGGMGYGGAGGKGGNYSTSTSGARGAKGGSGAIAICFGIFRYDSVAW